MFRKTAAIAANPAPACCCRRRAIGVDLLHSVMIGDAIATCRPPGLPEFRGWPWSAPGGGEQKALAAAAGFGEMMVFEDLQGALTELIPSPA
jgi:hypothetical protein